MSPHHKEEVAAAIMAALVTILSLLVMANLAGCAATPKTTPVVSTSALTGHLEQINSRLSSVDGKSVVIESWLKSH